MTVLLQSLEYLVLSTNSHPDLNVVVVVVLVVVAVVVVFLITMIY